MTITEERLDALAELAREGSIGWQGVWYATEGWLAEMEAFVSESVKVLPELIAEVRRLKAENTQIRKVMHGWMDMASEAMRRGGQMDELLRLLKEATK